MIDTREVLNNLESTLKVTFVEIGNVTSQPRRHTISDMGNG